MATVFYPAIVERAGANYSVVFPDLPGCTSAGATLHDAALAAEKALAGHLIISAEHGDEIPDPSPLDRIDANPDVDEVARIFVRADRPDIVRIWVTIDADLLTAIDRIAPNRSRFLADAARVALAARAAA